jgi:hypothetical protein
MGRELESEIPVSKFELLYWWSQRVVRENFVLRRVMPPDNLMKRLLFEEGPLKAASKIPILQLQ